MPVDPTHPPATRPPAEDDPDPLRRLEEEIRHKDQILHDLTEDRDRLEKALDSVDRWQRCWWRRAFHRWHRVETAGPPGFFRRLARSLQKRILRAPTPSERTPDLPPSPPPEPAPPEIAPAEEPGPREILLRRMEEELAHFLSTPNRIKLPTSSQPKVSILIPVHNRAALTFACLRAIENETVPIEVLLVDDASSDETSLLLQHVEGARVLTNPQEIGFARSLNRAAAQARGQHLLVLHNDARPRPHSITRALATMESSPAIGAVGGRLVLPDGTLWEAGNIVWQDGSRQAYGRGEPSDEAAFIFRRDVDFCSAAFLLLRKTVFENLGGWDSDFEPLVCGDADYCLRLHTAGHRVVYEPEAVVEHLADKIETDLPDTVVTACPVAERFREKHADALSRQQAPAPRRVLAARSRFPAGKHILFLDDLLPVKANGAGCPRALAMVWAFHAAGHFVTFCPVRDAETDPPAAYAVLPREIEILLGWNSESLRSLLSERQGFYETILVSRPHNMKTLLPILEENPLWFSNTRILYDAEAVFALRDIRKAELLGHPMDPGAAARLLAEETGLASAAAIVSVTSEKEADCFRAAGISRIAVLSHGLEARPGPNPFAARDGLLFVGRLSETDSPNTDSILWFLVKILPLIRQQLSREVPVHIVGKNAGGPLVHLQDSHLRFYGAVEDVAGYYDSARAFIAPTRYASGVPLKILEAAAHGVPVVTTSLPAGQLGWRAGREILVADEPAAFAAHCVHLLTEETLWSSVREQALARVKNDHAPEEFSRRVASLVD